MATVTSPPDDSLIKISNLSFAYDNRPILSGINLEIPRGKVVAIMGSSGCGKTTTLRLIGGQLKPTQGEVKVNGQVVPSWKAMISTTCVGKWACCFSSAPYSRYVGIRQCRFQMREHTDLPEDMIRDLVLMKLHAVGLLRAHDLMPSELSGGMARRVALARAIALDPMLIMYDEPFAGLDQFRCRLSAT